MKKKILFSAFSVVAVVAIIAVSCKSKNSSSAITPTYKDEATGTGNNPNTTQVTTTGTISTTGGSQQNSSLQVSGSTWVYPGCSGNSLSGANSATGTAVSITFPSAPTAGTYLLVSSNAAVTTGKACMTVLNPPSQPSGSTWYSDSGTITVTVVGAQVTATFTNIPCKQTNTQFPVVTVSGSLTCI